MSKEVIINLFNLLRISGMPRDFSYSALEIDFVWDFILSK